MNSLALELTGSAAPAVDRRHLGQVEHMRPGDIVPLAKTSLVEGRCSGIGKIAVGLIHGLESQRLEIGPVGCAVVVSLPRMPMVFSGCADVATSVATSLEALICFPCHSAGGTPIKAPRLTSAPLVGGRMK